MSELDVSTWKEFRIGDLFEIHPTKSYRKTNADLFFSVGKTPVVVNSAQNNGIGGFAVFNPLETGHIITFSDTTDANSIFYQPMPFIGYSHVQGMYPKFARVSDAVMLFIKTAFQKQAMSMNFDYTNKFRRDTAANIMIKLPATPSGDPDWAYMDSFMGKILEEEEAAAEQLVALAPETGSDGHFLDASGWKAFRIGDMFAVEPMPCKLSKGDLDNGHIPVYSSDSENYGILGYTSNDATYKITASKPFFVVFGDHTCNMSIVHVDFCVADNVKVLSPKIYISEDMLLFLLTAWKKNIKKLGYARHWSIAKDTNIFLPATPDGQPDWAWMEQYMQQQLDKSEKLAEHLNELN